MTEKVLPTARLECLSKSSTARGSVGRRICLVDHSRVEYWPLALSCRCYPIFLSTYILIRSHTHSQNTVRVVRNGFQRPNLTFQAQSQHRSKYTKRYTTLPASLKRKGTAINNNVCSNKYWYLCRSHSQDSSSQNRNKYTLFIISWYKSKSSWKRTRCIY